MLNDRLVREVVWQQSAVVSLYGTTSSQRRSFVCGYQCRSVNHHIYSANPITSEITKYQKRWDEIYQSSENILQIFSGKLWRVIRSVDSSRKNRSEYLRFCAANKFSILKIPEFFMQFRGVPWDVKSKKWMETVRGDPRGTKNLLYWRVVRKRDNFSTWLNMPRSGVFCLNLEFMYRCTRDAESWRERIDIPLTHWYYNPTLEHRRIQMHSTHQQLVAGRCMMGKY